MRWLSVLTITLLLAGAQCLSACALSAWTPQSPPCHQHHKAPIQSTQLCDHQNAIDIASNELGVAQPMLLPTVTFAPPCLGVSTTLAARVTLESPPPVITFAVLRT
jgi:hypothetical protein